MNDEDEDEDENKVEHEEEEEEDVQVDKQIVDLREEEVDFYDLTILTNIHRFNSSHYITIVTNRSGSKKQS